MTSEAIFVLGVLGAALVLFGAGRWRYDLVALLALLAVTVAGVVPADQAFAGFGHPAVITVAAVLVASRGLQNAGVVNAIAGVMLGIERPTLQVLSLTALVTLLSAFMNNIGALALLLPVAVQMARDHGRSPAFLLMPLAFGSLLGGMTTLIGTPPNIIIAAFRTESAGEPFRMFDFTPVGLGIAVAGVLFVSLIGWRLIPRRVAEGNSNDLFKVNEYVAEVQLAPDSPFVGRPLHELEEHAEGAALVLSLTRREKRTAVPAGSEPLQAGDVLSLEADPDSLHKLMESAKLTLGKGDRDLRETLGTKEVRLVEAVITPGSMLPGNTPWSLYLRLRYGINVIGVARYGSRVRGALRSLVFQSGDVLLVQGPVDTVFKSLATLGCLPLAKRGLRLGEPRRIGVALAVFGAAPILNALGVFPIQVSFALAAAGMVLARLVTLREAYESIDWPIIMLVGAMIPVGGALEATGGAAFIAQLLVAGGQETSPIVMVSVFLVATMFLSDLVNNAAAAILIAPIAIGTAARIGVSADPFLMAVAIGASCAFLTPIGHQSNAMVMVPGDIVSAITGAWACLWKSSLP